MTRRRRIAFDVPVYGRVMQYRGRQTRATMRRGPDRFDEPLNPLPVAPASPSMSPLDPPTGRRDFHPPTQVPSRHHRDDDMTCDCKDYPSLSLLGYTPLCIHRMIDTMSPRYAAYLPRDYTMHGGERGSDVIPVNEVPRIPNPPTSSASDATTEPDIVIYKGEPEDDDTEPDVVLYKRKPENDDSDLELTARTSNRAPQPDVDEKDFDLEMATWTSNRAPLSQLLLNPPFSIAH